MTESRGEHGGDEGPPPASLPQWAMRAPTPPIKPPSETLPKAHREYVATFGRIGWAIGIGALALGGAQFTRVLPEWDDGRWWMLTMALGIVAVGCGLFAVAESVGAYGESLRHRRAMKGGGLAVLTLALSGALLVAAGVRVVTDWDTLDVPAAWDRVDFSPDKNRLVDAIDDSRDVTTATGDDVRTRGRIGGCYTGDASDPVSEVECNRAHRLELVATVQLTGTGPYPGRDDLEAAAVVPCTAAVDQAVQRDLTGLDIRALVPGEVAWDAGDRQAACLVQFDRPVSERIAR